MCPAQFMTLHNTWAYFSKGRCSLLIFLFFVNRALPALRSLYACIHYTLTAFKILLQKESIFDLREGNYILIKDYLLHSYSL